MLCLHPPFILICHCVCYCVDSKSFSGRSSCSLNRFRRVLTSFLFVFFCKYGKQQQQKGPSNLTLSDKCRLKTSFTEFRERSFKPTLNTTYLHGANVTFSRETEASDGVCPKFSDLQIVRSLDSGRSCLGALCESQRSTCAHVKSCLLTLSARPSAAKFKAEPAESSARSTHDPAEAWPLCLHHHFRALLQLLGQF